MHGQEPQDAFSSACVQFLPAAPLGCRFTGTLGIYLKEGRIAFFRRWSAECLSILRALVDYAEADTDTEEGVHRDLGECIASATHPSEVEPAWETTGFCSEIWWTTGRRLTMCIAFRDEGPYQVRLTRIGRDPPAQPTSSRAPRWLGAGLV